MRLVTAATLASLSALQFLSSGAALAQSGEPKIANPSAIVDTLTPEAVQSLVAEMGGKDVQIRDLEGNKVITFVDGNIPYQFAVGGCDITPGKCFSLVMLVFADMGASGITTDMINSRNLDNFFNTAVKVDDKVIAFGRGVLLAGGVTRRNLAWNVGVYAGQVGEGIRHFSSQVVASRALPGMTQNLSFSENSSLRVVRPTPEQLSASLKKYNADLKSAVASRQAW